VNRRQRGLTLIELVVVLAVLGIIVASAVPSFAEALARQRLRAAAEHWLEHVYLAKAEALRTGQAVHFSVQTGEAACYGFRVGEPCDCSVTGGAQQCTLARWQADEAPGVTLVATTMADGTGRIEPVRGTVEHPGRLAWRAGTGQVLGVGLTSVGRVYACSPAGAAHLSGYASTLCEDAP
jgi:prepilin-type N-terminal cleavage/methylation domain-containing protein